MNLGPGPTFRSSLRSSSTQAPLKLRWRVLGFFAQASAQAFAQGLRDTLLIQYSSKIQENYKEQFRICLVGFGRIYDKLADVGRVWQIFMNFGDWFPILDEFWPMWVEFHEFLPEKIFLEKHLQ